MTLSRGFTTILKTFAGLAVVGAALVATALPAAALPDFGTAPVQEGPSSYGVRVSRIEAEQLDGFDRATFYLDGPGDPGHYLSYVPGFWDARDREVKVEGTTFLQVSVWGTTWLDGPSTRTGVTPRLPALREIKYVTEFEGEATYGVGLSNGHGFRVYELSDPKRLVVDVKH
jgi:hypothetical protein